MADGGSDLEAVLSTFDKVEANLARLEEIRSKLDHSGGDEYEVLRRSWHNLLPGLPAIDGFTVTAEPLGEDEITSLRVDAAELGEPHAFLDVERAIGAAADQLATYRSRFRRGRNRVTRDRALAVVAELDAMVGPGGRFTADLSTVDWDELDHAFRELRRLVMSSGSRRTRWRDFSRHLSFAQSGDLYDIINMDWPSVRADAEDELYDDDEPVLVDVDDLGQLVKARPTGPVSTRLPWEKLDADQFEGLIFELIRTAEGYENTNWLMQTNAPDKGRDVESYRVVEDSLIGTSRDRVIVQCKHWSSRSVSLQDLVTCVETVKLWEPPPVDIIVFATSGRFTQQAVEWVEKRRQERTRPAVEMWPESHIETLLARRPAVTTKFGLK
jgi:hypothetical protein